MTGRRKQEHATAPGEDGGTTALLERCQAELAEARTQLAACVEGRRHFLANLGHDLRTPLTTIMGFSGVLLDRVTGPLTEEQAKQVGMIQASARQLVTGVEDLLEIAQVEAGAIQVTPTPTDLMAALHDARVALQERAGPDGAVVEVLGVPATVQTDVGRLKRLLAALGRHALAACAQGRVTLTLAPDGEGATITVRDDGEARSQEELDGLLERYRRLGDARARSGGNVLRDSGLALALAAAQARLLGITLEARALPGEGTSVVLRLPARPPAQPH
jgi:signal transduction histidine kinase